MTESYSGGPSLQSKRSADYRHPSIIAPICVPPYVILIDEADLMPRVKTPGLRRQLFNKYEDAAQSFFLHRWEANWEEELRDLVDKAIRFHRVQADWLVRAVIEQSPADPIIPPRELGHSASCEYLRALLQSQNPRGFFKGLSLEQALYASIADFERIQRHESDRRAEQLARREEKREPGRLRRIEIARRDESLGAPIIARSKAGYTIHVLRSSDLRPEGSLMNHRTAV